MACPDPPVRLLRTAAAPAAAPPPLPGQPAGRCRLLPRRPGPPPPLAATAPPLFCSPNIPTAEIPQPDSLSALTVNSGGRLLEPGPWPPPLLAGLVTSSSSSSSSAVSSRSCRLRGQPATQPAAGRSHLSPPAGFDEPVPGGSQHRPDWDQCCGLRRPRTASLCQGRGPDSHGPLG